MATPAKKTSTTTSSTRTTEKSPAKKASAKKAPAKKAPDKKAPDKKATTSSAKASTQKTPTAKGPTTSAKSSTAAKSKGAAKDLLVKSDESPWTAAELAEVRAELEAEIARHENHARAVSADLADLLESADSSGGDAADVGTSNFERDQELTLAAHAQDALSQCRLALSKMDNGTYGQCDQCGEPIGKGRLQVYPRATLCLPCKQREERR